MAKKSVKLYTDNVIEESHSDVFYVREAVQNHYGRPFTLEHVEWAMRKEGWVDGNN